MLSLILRATTVKNKTKEVKVIPSVKLTHPTMTISRSFSVALIAVVLPCSIQAFQINEMFKSFSQQAPMKTLAQVGCNVPRLFT